MLFGKGNFINDSSGQVEIRIPLTSKGIIKQIPVDMGIH